VAETPKKQAKTAHIDHFRGPTKMMAAAGRLKDGKTPFERLFLCPADGLWDGTFCLKTALGGQMGGQMGGQNSKKNKSSLPI